MMQHNHTQSGHLTFNLQLRGARFCTTNWSIWKRINCLSHFLVL